ncbi:MAG: DUF3365 domain-containing protein, partial [Endomicrobia bacterium]|nr:DUF3365 domain-containing protein [Endomicrobiia bacterium]
MFARDVTVRKFVAKLGGVYGDIEKISPNPYLNVPNREIHTDKKTFTLINPSYFIRNVFELMQQDYGIKSRITSLKLKNPNNTPNDIEKEAIQEFEKGKKEFYKFININGERVFFYMAPLFIEESCLKCHNDQGYKVGDLRGGISIYLRSNNLQNFASLINKVETFFLSTIFLFFCYFFYKYNKKVEENLISSRLKEESFRKIAEKSNDFIVKFDKNLKAVYFNKDIESLFGSQKKVEYFKDILDMLEPPKAETIKEAIKNKIKLEDEFLFKNQKILQIKIDFLENDETIVFLTDITYQRLYLDFLETFTNKLSLLNEIDFFNELNRYITKYLNIDYSFVGIFAENNFEKIRSLSIAKKGEIIENFEYDLKGTPCNNVTKGTFCLYKKDVADLFPEDYLLKEMNITGYAGIPILSHEGNVLGIFVMLSEKEITYPEIIENLTKTVAPKIASDLEKIKYKKTIELISKILEKSEIGILICDEKFNTLYQNTAFYEKAIKSFYNIDKPWAEKIIEDLRYKDDSFIEFIEDKAEGSQHYLITINKLKGVDVNYLFIKQNITNYKKIEQQLLQSQKMEAIGLLSAGIVHDFNNILTGILNYGNLIQLTTNNPETNSYSQEIIRCVEMASNLTKNLLLFTKKQPQETQIIDLNIIVNNILKIIKRTFPENI